MRLASRLFLLSEDDALHALPGAAFMRMLRKEGNRRLPDFAGQRVRQASVAVAIIDRQPVRVVHRTYCVLDVDANGLLDVERLSLQQFARVEDLLISVPQVQPTAAAAVVDASRRFIARGGTWEPQAFLQRKIDATALGQLSCRRVRVVP